MEKTNDTIIEYYMSANWAFINGNFTPECLREIAEEIQKKHKEFQGGQAEAKEKTK